MEVLKQQSNAEQLVFNLISARWQAQTVHAAVKTGLFELLSPTESKSIVAIAEEANVDAGMCYRVLRALASLGFLREIAPTTSSQPETTSVSRREGSQFLLTDAGCLLRKDHPKSMAAMLLMEESPQHCAIWMHLPAILKDGQQDAFVREYGRGVFEYAKTHPEYDFVFNEAMSSNSRIESESILTVLQRCDFSEVKSVCDIGGGHGYLLSKILQAYPHIDHGIVMDLAHVTENEKNHYAGSMGVADRCTYMAGDMFKDVPCADIYFIKHVLHDWNDTECGQILANTHKASLPGARLYVCERVIPGPNEPSIASLVDVYMAVACTGRERTADEYEKLFEDAGWTFLDRYETEMGDGLSLMEAVRK